jgi:hypothetical protein
MGWRSLVFVGTLVFAVGCGNGAAEVGSPEFDEIAAGAPTGSAAATAEDPNSGPALVLHRYRDRTEGAFTILVPAGWQTQGGMLRIDPTAAGGAAQSIEAKLDFAVKSDDRGTVSVRWLPHIYYVDQRHIGLAAGMFPPGSNYGGMTVVPLMSAAEFATQMVFPHLHGRIQMRVVETQPLPGVARVQRELFSKRLAPYLPMPLNFQFDAAAVTLEYTEDGVAFREVIVVLVEDRGPLVSGQWCNRFTLVARAPVDQFERWAPVLKLIADSSRPDPQWVRGEIRGQMQRNEIMARTQQEVQRIEQEIVEHRRRTMAEIANDGYLNLTGQEEYVNPYSGEVELGSNEWNHRWQNDSGDVIYTDDPNYDPNRDPSLHVQNYRQSKIRQRFPG